MLMDDEAMERLEQSGMETLDESLSLEAEIKACYNTDEKGNPKGRPLHHKFGDLLKKRLSMVTMGDRVYWFNGKYYQDGMARCEREMIKLIPDIKNSERIETYRYINRTAEEIEVKPSDMWYIAFNNCVVDLHDMGTMTHWEAKEKGIVITACVPHDYNPDAYSEAADKVLDNLSNGDLGERRKLEEALGMRFYRSGRLRYSEWDIGEKANGKTTWVEDIGMFVIGEENSTQISLEQMVENRFATAELAGSTLYNFSDDVDAIEIRQAGILRRIISGQKIMLEKKGEQPFGVKLAVTLAFSANVMPRVKDQTGAFQSRMHLIFFDQKFDKENKNYDPFIAEKLHTEEAAQYFINVGMWALREILYTNGAFTVTERERKALREFHYTSQPNDKFFDEVLTRDETIGNPTDLVYARYERWTKEEDMSTSNIMSKTKFSQEIKRRYKLVTASRRIGGKNGGSVRVYVEPTG